MRRATKRRLRREVALRAGCEPGEMWLEIRCTYCTWPLVIIWREGGEPEFWMRGRGTDVEGLIEPAHLDHIIPEHRNGCTSLDNTAVVCAPCNLAKGGAALGDAGFLAWLDARRVLLLAGVVL